MKRAWLVGLGRSAGVCHVAIPPYNPYLLPFAPLTRQARHDVAVIVYFGDPKQQYNRPMADKTMTDGLPRHSASVVSCGAGTTADLVK
jgi:hypothetical protein